MLRLHLFPAFGDVFVDAISKTDVERWLAVEAKKVQGGEYSPLTVNNWLRLFRGIMNEAVDELGLDKNPATKVTGLDASTRATYTEEEPNALAPEEVQPFLLAMRDRHPQHLAMVALGFATGWRPSMMRPLRRKGGSADVLWDKNVVLARRSQTRGDEVREATKNSTRFRVTLPSEVDDRSPLARRSPVGRKDAGERSPVSLRDGRLPQPDRSRQAVQGRLPAPPSREEGDAEGDASDIPRPRPSGGGRWI